MGTPQIEFDDFIMFSLEEANRKFRHTNESQLARERVDQITADCKNRFGDEDYSFIESCFEVLLQADGLETEFCYKQGYKDCVALLKKLEVL